MASLTSLRRSRWLRFSLRSLLLAVTIFCIWLGLRVRQAQRRHEAVAAILAAGGTVWFDYQWAPGEIGPIPNGEPRAPAWLRSIFGDDFFRHPAMVGLGDVTDEFIAKYADALPGVHVLGISSENVTDKSLTIVAKMSQLQFLDVSCPNLTPAGLRQLAPLTRLKTLISYTDKENEKCHSQLYPRGNFDCPGDPLDMLPEILTAQFHCGAVQWDLLEGEQLPDKLLTETINNSPLQAVIEKTMKDCHLDYVVRVQNHAIVIASAAAARAHWPGYTTLHEMFPNLSRLEADW